MATRLSERKTQCCIGVPVYKEQQIYEGSNHRGMCFAQGALISHPTNLEHGIMIHGSKGAEVQSGTVLRVIAEHNPMVIINVVVCGRVKFAFDDSSFDVSADNKPQVVVINLCEPSSFQRDIIIQSNLNKLNLLFTHQWLESNLGNCLPKTITNFLNRHQASMQFDATEHILALTHDFFETQDTATNQLVRESVSLQILSEVLKVIEANDRITNKHEPQDCGLVTEVVKLLNLYDPKLVAVEQLSHCLGCSEKALKEQFQHKMGMTINEYARISRLEKARYAISSGASTISQAAYESGYEHPSNFTSAFRRLFGYSPSMLLKQESEAT